MLHLALKAFAPAPLPFAAAARGHRPQLPEVLEYRDRTAAEHGLRLVVAHVQDYIDDGRLSSAPTAPATRCRRCRCWTRSEQQFDAVFGGGRRDEEKARAKERVFSLRDDFGQWDPKRQRPELWHLYNGRHKPGEHVRVFPLSNWTELDVWQYIAQEQIELPSIYFTHQPEVFARGGMWLAPGDWGGARGPASASRARRPLPHRRRHVLHRRRRLGRGHRAGRHRGDQRVPGHRARGLPRRRPASEAAMEDRKREGYF